MIKLFFGGLALALSLAVSANNTINSPSSFGGIDTEDVAKKIEKHSPELGEIGHLPYAMTLTEILHMAIEKKIEPFTVIQLKNSEDYIVKDLNRESSLYIVQKISYDNTKAVFGVKTFQPERLPIGTPITGENLVWILFQRVDFKFDAKSGNVQTLIWAQEIM